MSVSLITALESRPESCRHCGGPVPLGARLDGFCCAGCRAVFALLHDEGLTRYYDLVGASGSPVPEAPRERSFAWLDPLLAQAEAAGGSVARLELDVQGIHCAGCVWLMNELYARRRGGAQLTVNPALGKVTLAWRRGELDVRAFLGDVERFGYLFGPSRKWADRVGGSLPLRLGICVAITMNVMLFSLSFYVGLAPEDGEIFTLFTRLSLWLSGVVVVVGGWPFFVSAWRGLRSGVLHLDLPIALGILTAFGVSMAQARDGRGDRAYLDTLNVFVTLMLVGRWLQQRILERNRRFLLEDDGADGISVRRRAGGRIDSVRAPAVRAGDDLVIAPGDLVPVDAELLDAAGRFSTDWITGEARVRELAVGAEVLAGSFNAGDAAVAVRARTGFADSPLPGLLSASPAGAGRAPAFARFYGTVARRYVLGVLTLAAAGLVAWWPRGAGKALDVTVALLVVTCPCALGIAIPLAYEMVQARLRRVGLFVRSADLLDRLPRVRKLLFDKTGTLTLGRLELADPAAARGLPEAARDAAYDMAVRSNHPVSRCLCGELAAAGARFAGEARVVEQPGRGLELERDGAVWRLGAAAWAAPGVAAAGTVLSRDGAVVAAFDVRESVRADARREIAALSAEGREVWLVSGDEPARVAQAARALGVPEAQALGGQRPEDKAATVARLDRDDTLFLGDGVNDSLAFERALCAGTPAIGRPVMPGKADFFLLGEGISALREALALAARLRVVVRRDLAIALGYNVLAVAACLAGWMTPLRAAIAMPASSITVLLLTAHALAGPRRRRPAPRPVAASPVEVPA